MDMNFQATKSPDMVPVVYICMCEVVLYYCMCEIV